MVVSVPSDRVSPTRSVPWLGPRFKEADDIAGESFIGNFALAGEKEDGVVDGDAFSSAKMGQFHAAFEPD